MNSISIISRVPIQAAPFISIPGLIFNQWLPTTIDQALETVFDEMRVAIWIPRDGVEKHFGLGPETGRWWVNVAAGFLCVQITVQDVSNDVLIAIRERAAGGRMSDSEHYIELDRIGQRVYDATISCANQIVHFARTLKGQYWLEPIQSSPNLLSAISELQPLVCIDKEKPMPWRPTDRQMITGMVANSERFITPNDWSKMRRTFASGARTWVASEILVNAEELAARGHRRAAVAEAYTALEVAISQLGKQTELATRWKDKFLGRIDAKSLGDHSRHLGVKATVHYLLPLLFGENQLPNTTARDLRDAVEVRNNVVHNGMRNVAPSDCWRFLKAIRDFCALARRD